MLGTMRVVAAMAAGLLAVPPLLAPASAQDFPSKPIRLIVPFPPGGPVDIIARATGEKAAGAFGQPVVIENRPGAAGVTGIVAVSKADPDGYTIGISASSILSIHPSLADKPQLDPATSLTLVTQFVSVPELLAVNESVPARSLAELVALAKSQPGKLSFATPGIGTISHLVMEMLKVNAGINVVHVPYTGAAPAINDLLGGHVQMLFADLPILIGNVKGGKLRPIAVGSERRARDLPDVPTARELGWTEVVADNWYGLVAPPRLPQAILDRIHGVIVGALKSPEVSGKLESQGNIIVGNSPAEFAAYVKSESAKWARVIRTAGLKPN